MDIHCIFIRYTTGSTSNHIAWMSDNFYFAKLLSTLGILALVDVDVQGASGAINSQEALGEGVAAGTRNKMSYQEYTRYIPGIFKVYNKSRPVDKLRNLVAGLAQRLFIVLLPYNRAFALHLPVSPPYFLGIYNAIIHVIIFLIHRIS